MSAPDTVVYTEDGWWMKWERDRLGWLWVRIDRKPGLGAVNACRYSDLPAIVETYQPSSVIHALARGEEAR